MIGARRRGRRIRAARRRASAASAFGTPASDIGSSTFSRGRQHRQQEEALKHEADVPEAQQAAARVGQPADVLAVEEERAGRVCVSTQPSMCSSVDFPQPDGPRTAM